MIMDYLIPKQLFKSFLPENRRHRPHQNFEKFY